MRYYPVFLDLAGQVCIVLGDGRLAAEKAAALREAGADVRVIANRDYRRGRLRGARLVVDASEDAAINQESWAEAEREGILINVVDRPEQCRFIAPAIVRRDPLVIAISTSGESPFLASALRARLERWLGKEWGPFTSIVGRIRQELRGRGVPIDVQARIYKRLMTSDIRALLRAGNVAGAQRAAASLGQVSSTSFGRVALVGAGPGDSELLTVRARELLAGADYVLHDDLVTAETLSLCGPDTRLEYAGKRGGRASTRQADITARLIQLARDGHFVVRLKGGDPFVFGRGGEELRDLVAAGIDVVVVPGVSAAVAAPAAAGIPVTMRGVASSVAITTAEHDLRPLATAADTLVVLMAHARLEATVASLREVLGAHRPAAVIAGATLPEQQVVVGTLADIARKAQSLRPPSTLVVGEVVAEAAAPALIDLVRFG